MRLTRVCDFKDEALVGLAGQLTIMDKTEDEQYVGNGGASGAVVVL